MTPTEKNTNEWIDIWKKEPPRDKEILFMTGDEEIHLGELNGSEKLRKCCFRSFTKHDNYDCDLRTPLHDRVIYWHPLPTIPFRNNPYLDDMPECYVPE